MGIFTTMITPYKADGNVDYEACEIPTENIGKNRKSEELTDYAKKLYEADETCNGFF